MENFTGRSVLSVRQDFHARILSQTLTAMTIQTAQHYLSPAVQRRKLAYKINFAQTLSAMKNTMIHLLFGTLGGAEMNSWLQSISKSLSAIRPGRSFTRKKKMTPRHKFHPSYKRAL